MSDEPAQASENMAGSIRSAGQLPVRHGDSHLDALSAILPVDRHGETDAVLARADIATLRHLAHKGMGANTLRAMVSDLAYLEAWSRAADQRPLDWPVDEATVLSFIAHHLWDPAERERDPRHGMPVAVERRMRADGRLRVSGPHAISTVRRRLALWATLHRWRAVEGPFRKPTVRNALRLAALAAERPRGRKSAQAVTRDVLDCLVATCAEDSLVDKRDRALLLIAFGSGGRRRSEVARLAVEDLVERPSTPSRRDDPTAPRLRSLEIRLGRTKTASAEKDERVVTVGRPVDALSDWMTAARISSGPIFRKIDRWERVGDAALDPQSVNAILKRRCRLAGLDDVQFSAHGLRSGYLTEAARQGVPLVEAMRQTRHRSMQQASAYYNEVEIERGESARLG